MYQWIYRYYIPGNILYISIQIYMFQNGQPTLLLWHNDNIQAHILAPFCTKITKKNYGRGPPIKHNCFRYYYTLYTQFFKIIK